MPAEGVTYLAIFPFVSQQGVTTYYSCNCVKKDLQLIQQFMTEKVQVMFAC